MIWGTDDLVRTSLFPGSRPLERNTIFIIAVRINLWQPAIEEHTRSWNWNGLQRGRDGGIRSDQISSVLLAVCKQLLINNIVTVRRQMTPRLQKHTHAQSFRAGKLPSVSAHAITHTFYFTHCDTTAHALPFVSSNSTRDLYHLHLNSEEGNHFYP